MPSDLFVQITAAQLEKAEKAFRRGKATARQAALMELEAELEELVNDREPDELQAFSDYTPIIQRFWADAAGELHVEAQIHASFVIPSSATSESLKRHLGFVSDYKTGEPSR